jgi:hypothetical protein
MTESKSESIARILRNIFNRDLYFKICITLPSKLELQEIRIFYVGLFIKFIQTSSYICIYFEAEILFKHNSLNILRNVTYLNVLVLRVYMGNFLVLSACNRTKRTFSYRITL